MKMTFLAIGCAALVGLQGCCKKSDASSTSSAADTGTTTSTPVPVVETSKPPAQLRTYTMDWPGDGKLTYVRIKQIVVGPDGTSVTIMLKNSTGKAMSVATAAPGAKDAFFIQRADHKKRFKLLRVEGIPISPQRTDVPNGGSIQFTLTFEPIESGMTVFDVYESDQPPTATTSYWNFSDVKLQ